MEDVINYEDFEDSDIELLENEELTEFETIQQEVEKELATKIDTLKSEAKFSQLLGL